MKCVKIATVLSMVVVVLFVQSCCKKKYCATNRAPTLNIVFNNFADSDLRNKVLYTYDKNTGKVIDSLVDHTTAKGFNCTPPSAYGQSTTDLLDYYFVTRIGKRWDTINHITYTVYSYTVKCSTCNPLNGNNNETSTDFRDMSYTLDNNVYKDLQTVTINH